MSTMKQRLWIGRGLLVCGAGYGVYKIYNSEKVKHVLHVAKLLLAAGWNIAEVVAATSELSSKVLSDLNQFIDSEHDEIPPRFVQLSKLLASDEMCHAASAITLAIVEGAGNAGLDEEARRKGIGVVDRILEKVIDKLLSDRGRNLVSLAVSVAVRSTVQSMCRNVLSARTTSTRGEPVPLDGVEMVQSLTAGMLSAMATENGDRLLKTTIGSFAENFVQACGDSLEGSSIVESVLSTISRPESIQVMSEIVGASSREAVASFVSETSRRLSGQTLILPPPSVSVNNFHEEACPSSPPGSPDNASVINHHDLAAVRRSTGQTESGIGEPHSCSSVGTWNQFDMFAHALGTICKVPETQDLVLRIAGSIAKEGTKGMMLSFPDLTATYWSMIRKANFFRGQEVSLTSSPSALLTVLLSAILYATTRIMVS